MYNPETSVTLDTQDRSKTNKRKQKQITTLHRYINNEQHEVHKKNSGDREE